MSAGGEIGEKLESLYYEIDMRTQGFERGIDEAKHALTKFTQFIAGNPMLVLAALGAALLAVGYKATEMAADVDRSVRKVQAAMPLTTAQLKTLRQGLEDISRESPHTQAELAEVAAEIARMGVSDPAEILQRLRIGTQIADAASVDLKQTLEALDTVADQFRLTTTQAGDALTRMFAITQGKIPLDELFATMERGGSVLASFNLNVIDVAEAMTTLKDAGVVARQVGTTLLTIMAVVENAAKGQQMATTSQQDAMRTLADELNPATIATKGFAGAVAGLVERVHGSRDALKQMGFEAKSINGLFRIAESVHADLRSESEKLADAQQKVHAAFTLNREDAAALNAIIHNNLNATLIDLGNTILPVVNKGMQAFLAGISEAYDKARKFDDAVSMLRKGGGGYLDTGSGASGNTALDYFATRLKDAPDLFRGLPIEKLREMLRIADTMYGTDLKYVDVLFALRHAYNEARVAADAQSAAEKTAAAERVRIAAAEEAQRRRRAAADLAERQASGIASAQGGFDALTQQYTPGSEGDIDAKIATLVAAAQRAHMAASEIAANVVAVRKAVGAGAAETATELQRAIDAKLAEMTATQADNFRLATEQTVAALHKQLEALHALGSVDGVRLTQMYAQVAAIERQAGAAADVLSLTEQLAAEDRDASVHVAATNDARMIEYHRLGDQVVKLITASQAQIKGSTQQLALEELIAAKKREQAQLMAIIEGKTVDVAETDAQRLLALERQSRLIQEFGHGIIQAANAMGVLDDKTAQSLDNVVALAAALPRAVSGDPTAIASAIGSAFSLAAEFFARMKELTITLADLERQASFRLTLGKQQDDPVAALKEFVLALHATREWTKGGLADFFTGLDLGSTGDLATLRKRIQDAYARSGSGWTSAQLDMIKHLLELLDTASTSLTPGSGADDSGTGGYSVSHSITEVTGMRLAGLITTSNVYLAEMSASLKTMLSLSVPGVVPPPTSALRGGALSLAQASGASIVIGEIRLDIAVSVNGTLSRDDAESLGIAIGQGAVQQINRALATDQRLKTVAAGAVILSP